MLMLSDDDILQNTVAYSNAYDKLSKVVLTGETFFTKAIPKLMADYPKTSNFPYEIRIPKSTNALIAGDLEPAKVIRVEKPFMGPFGPMWFGDSTNGIRLLAGYKNGDSRYVCDQLLGDGEVHGFLAGSTGQGKSVTMNTFIYGICYMYGPWDVELTLCDPKIVEFKTIAVTNPMPQVKAVAATGDVDYLVSVLRTRVNEMNKRNAMFTAVGKVLTEQNKKKFGKNADAVSIKNIADFRKKTGLTLPQELIIIDEVQTMIKDAGKKSGEIMSLLDALGRLGRNTGYHLLLASQEVGSEISGGLMANIKLRMAMGCFAEVSSKILNNDAAAANMGQKGKMILNKDPAVKVNKDLNVTYQVPYLDPDMGTISKANREKGAEVGITIDMNFYDEEKAVRESEYTDYLKQFNVNKNSLYFGEVSKMTYSKENCLKIDFTNQSLETMMVFANTDQILERYFLMFQKNISLVKGVSNLVLCAHPTLENEIKVSQYAAPNFYFNDAQYEDNQAFKVAQSNVYKRKLILMAESAIFSGNRIRNDSTDAWFDSFVKNPELDTELNRERYAHYVSNLRSSSQLQIGFNLANMSKEARDAKIQQLAVGCLDICNRSNANSVQMTVDKFTIFYIWILGVDSIVGLGRGAKSKCITELATTMMEASKVNMRYVLFTTSLTDISELIVATRWFVTEGISQTQAGKMKCECYPAVVRPVLGVLYDSTDKENGCQKFKKMLRDDEILD